MNILTEHQKAALKFDRHISLTANAGSGKTFVLSKRYLEIALSQNYPNLRSIAAISFTDKAASELYKKIANEIEGRLKSEKNPEIVKKLNTIRRQLVSANISTIHSFCIDILREFPVEAGLDANFTPIDEQLSNELIELSVDELIKSSFKEKDEGEKLKYLVRILGSKSILTKELISFIKKRKNVLVIAEKLYNKSVDEIAQNFENEFHLTLRELFSDKVPFISEAIKKINSEVLNKEPDNDIAIETAVLLTEFSKKRDLLEKIIILNKIRDQIITGNNTVKKRGYLNSEQYESLLTRVNIIENFYSELNNIEIPENHKEIETELAKFGKILIDFFNKAVDIYSNKKKENAYLDYEDILLFVQKILNNSLVQKSLSKKYHYIMIDEYQDTNEIQYNIFLPILDHLKKGNLFVVGDEKQSIYMFRDAELEVFNRTKEDIERTEGENKILTLPESFRMSYPISLFTNKLFTRLFENPDHLFNEVEYNELIAAAEVDSEDAIEILLASKQESQDSDDEEAEEDGNAEDELIARRIQKLVCDRKIDYNDVAILCRRRKEFKELENTFVKHKIPFIVVGGKGFYQRQSIYDVYNYFSFLLDADNDTALVGTLRSSFFNISDSVIYEISLANGRTYWEKFQNFSSNNKNFGESVRILSENLRVSTSYELTSLLRKILDESPFLAVIASRSNSVQELANIRKLTEITTNFNSSGFKTLYDYVSYLKESINQMEDESQAVVMTESNSVKIMTYHQAKGLEFKAVFLHMADKGLSKESIKAKSINVNKKFGLLTKVPLNNDISSNYLKAPIVGIAGLIEEKKSLAEFKRLFYVGVTRAINYLFICGTEKKNNKYDNNSILGMISNGLGLSYDLTEFNISSKLKFTELKENKFVNGERKVNTNIKIIRELEKTDFKETEESILPAQIRLNANPIKDQPEGEFISATKVAVYKQCPLKYQLTYEYGFTKLFDRYKSWFNEKTKLDSLSNEYEFNIEEAVNDNIFYEAGEKGDNNFAEVKGRIIHKILQNEINEKSLEEFIADRLKHELDIFDYSEKLSLALKESILYDVKNFYSSSFYSNLKSFTNYKNEFEVYIKENDYFLYGIIDKLIIEKSKITIIDYKTDDISEEEINERVGNYLPQLEFYAYIITQFIKKKKEIELKLAFIKYPDKIFSKSVKPEDFERINKEIMEMVNTFRGGKFSKNLDHCNKCLYALRQEKCIINNQTS